MKSIGTPSRSALLSATTALAGLIGPATAAELGPIPLLLDGGRPNVEVMIDGAGPYRFILDTGAGSGVVDATVATELGLSVVGSDDTGAPGLPTQRVDVVEARRVQAGGVAVEEDRFVVLDLGVAAGVLAPQSLPGGRVTLDFPAGEVRLDGAALDPDAAGTLAFDFHDGLITVPLVVGERSLPAHLDTGSPGGLMLPLALTEGLPMAGEMRTVGRARLFGGESDVLAARLDGMAVIGPLRLEEPEVHVLDLPLPAANLGTALFVDRVVDIDYDARLLRISEPSSHVAAARHGGPSPRRRLGLALAPGAPGPGGLPLVDGALPVSGVDPGSLADQAGIRGGDRITAVDGTPADELQGDSLGALFGGTDAVELTIERDGELLTLTVGGT